MCEVDYFDVGHDKVIESSPTSKTYEYGMRVIDEEKRGNTTTSSYKCMKMEDLSTYLGIKTRKSAFPLNTLMPGHKGKGV